MSNNRFRLALRSSLCFGIVACLISVPVSSAAAQTTTPDSGLRIHGTVHLAFDGGPGLPGVDITRGYAGPGPVAAQTDADGNYQSSYSHLSNSERVIVYAELAGYTLDPHQVEWEQDAHELTDKTVNFVARPLVTTCSTPAPLPKRIVIFPFYNTDTTESSAYFDLSIGMGGQGVESKGLLSVVGPAAIVSPLMPLTANFFTVYGQFDYGPGCSYITSTQFDSYGRLLRINQKGISPTGAPTAPPTKNS